MWGYYGSGSRLEMSGYGSYSVMTLKGDPTKTLETYNFDKLVNLFLLKNQYSEVTLLGPQNLLSSWYLTFGSVALRTYLQSTIRLHDAVRRYS